MKDLLSKNSTTIGESLGTLIFHLLGGMQIREMELFRVDILESFPKCLLKLVPSYTLGVEIHAAVKYVFAAPVKRRVPTSSLSSSCRLPNRAMASMAQRNSSNGVSDSELDHLGMRDTNDKSLSTVGVPNDIRSLNL